MAWFSKQIEDLETAYLDLLSNDEKLAASMQISFSEALDDEVVGFLCEKFRTSLPLPKRMVVIEIFVAAQSRLSDLSFKYIFQLVDLFDKNLIIKLAEILYKPSRERLKIITSSLPKVTNKEVFEILLLNITKAESSVDLLHNWYSLPIKDKLAFIEEMVYIAKPEVFEIVIDILRDDYNKDAELEKRALQSELIKHIEKIHSPDFIGYCLKDFVVISYNMRYFVIKTLQKHGELFYEDFFNTIRNKGDNLKIHVLKIMDQICDFTAYRFFFMFLSDKLQAVRQVTADLIKNYVRSFCEELSQMSTEKLRSEPVRLQINYFLSPLEMHLTDEYLHSVDSMSHAILRIGRYKQSAIISNFANIYKYSASFLKKCVLAMSSNEQKEFLVILCCQEDSTNGEIALHFLDNPSLAGTIETLRLLVVGHFLELAEKVQVELIKQILNPGFKDVLIEAVDHVYPQQRSKVLKILNELGTEALYFAVERRICDMDSSVRMAALEVLKSRLHKEEKQAISYLAQLVSDPDISIQMMALETIKDIEHPKVLEEVSPLCNSRNPTVAKLAKSIVARNSKKRYLTAFYSLSDELRCTLGDALVKLDPNFVEENIVLLSDSDKKKRQFAAKILHVLSHHLTSDQKAALIVALHDSDSSVRALIIMTMGKIGGPSVANLLSSFLEDPDERVRANTVEAIGNLGDDTLIEKVLPRLNDVNNRIRGNAILALWKMQYYDIHATIIHMLNDKDKWMRATVAYVIGEMEDPRFAPTLLNYLNDNAPEVRRNVVKSLAKILPVYQLVPYLKPMLYDKDQDVRKEVNSILKIKPKEK